MYKKNIMGNVALVIERDVIFNLNDVIIYGVNF